MRVLQINTVPNGSTGNLAKSIHSALISQGNESQIYYGFGFSDDARISVFTSMLDVHIHSVLSRYLGMQGYFSQFPTLNLINKIKNFKPDIVHLHNIHGSYVNVPMLLKFLKKNDIKTVVTLHDCWLFTGKCPHFTAIGCDKWKENCGNCPQLSRYPKAKIDRTSKSLSDKKKWLNGFKNIQIVAVSNWLKEVAEQSFLNEYPISAIYNGIDCEIFNENVNSDVRKKYDLGEKFVVLGVASPWSKVKGLDDFISLSAMLSKDEIIVLVGLSQEQISQMPQNIIGIERTENQQELADLYKTANVFVNGSTEETFGLVVAEAMACGTPAIVYNSTACPELIKEGTGYVVSPNDVSAVYSSIQEIKSKGKEYYSQNCVENVQDNYTKEKMVNEYLSLYRKTLKNDRELEEGGKI